MVAVQTEFSLWTRNVELGILETTAELGIALVAFCPIARGALGGDLRDPQSLGEKDLRRSHHRFSCVHWPKNLALIEQFEAIAIEAGIAPAQLALAWVLAQGDHIHAIPGTTSRAHARENFAAADLAVSAEILDQADSLINQSTVHGHRYPDIMRGSIDTKDYA